MADEKETYTKEEMQAIIAERDAIKANRDEALTEAKRAKAALKAWDGKDPTKYDQLLAASEEAERKRAAAEGDFESLKKQMSEKHSQELAAKDKRLGKYESALTKRLTSDELRKALNGKADPQYLELLVEHGSKFVRIRETDDGFEQYVSDEKGNPLVADGQATPMTLDVFVDQNLKTKFPGAFLGTGSSGGGAPRSIASGGGQKVIAANDAGAFFANVNDLATGKAQVAAP